MTTMKKQELTLAGVPAILYGKRSRKVYLYIHGKNGCKEEAERFANTACSAGWQVLAIDLPEHGARRDRPEQLLPWAVVPEIQAVYARMQPVWPHIRLYGVSIGAWLAMQALRAEKLEKALLVSPVVDMETLILSMMQGRPCHRRTAEGSRGDPHGDERNAFVAVSVLGAGASPAVAYTHPGAVRRQGCADLPCGDGAVPPAERGTSDHPAGRGTLVPRLGADGCCANVGRSKPLIFKTTANKNAADGRKAVSGILPILLSDAPI